MKPKDELTEDINKLKAMAHLKACDFPKIIEELTTLQNRIKGMELPNFVAFVVISSLTSAIASLHVVNEAFNTIYGIIGAIENGKR